MNPILISFGSIKIYWYSVIMFLAILLGGLIVLKEAKKFKIPENFMVNLFFYLIPIALIGARLYYVIFNFDYYMQDPISIFKVWEGGLAIHGGLIAGLLFIIFYTKKYKIKTLRILDFIVIGLILGQAIGRWGNFFNSEAHGAITTLQTLHNLLIPDFIIEGMHIGGFYYHPTFLYESIWCLLGFSFLVLMRKYSYLKVGQLTSLYLIWYGVGRFFIEGMRTDSLMLGSIKMAQLVSFLMVIIGLIMFLTLNKGSKFQNLYNGDDDDE